MPRRGVLGGVLWLLAALPAWAEVALDLGVQRLVGAGMVAEGLQGRARVLADGRRPLELRWQDLKAEGTDWSWPNHGLRCADSVVTRRRFACHGGRLLPDGPELALEWRREAAQQRLEIRFPRPGAGTDRLELIRSAAGYQLTADLSGGALGALQQGFWPALEGWTLSGELGLNARWGNPKAAADWSLGFSGLTFSGPAGLYAGEGLAGALSGAFNGASGSHRFRLEAGALLTPWFYYEPADAALELNLRSVYNAAAGELILERAELSAPGVSALDGRAKLLTGEGFKVQELTLNASGLDLGVLYRRFLQPVLGATALEQAQVQGQADIRLTKGRENGWTLGLSLRDGRLADRRQGDDGASLFGLRGVMAELVWRSDRPGRATLGWESAHLWDQQLAFGAATLEFLTEPDGGRLSRAASLAFLSGQLSLKRLELHWPMTEQGLEFGAALSNLDLARFSEAAGWRSIDGTAQGVIDSGRYDGREMALEGRLQIRAFGGEIEVPRFAVSGLFGALPAAETAIKVRRLDLQRLTRTFSFGKITGSLNGDVDGLYLEDWRPVAFDARFANPDDDPEPHRISQRAVDNLTDLGGSGASGALSRGLLQMFDTFRYDRLGFGCRLQNGVCELSGLGPAEQGYYLVQGGGLPRISVVGINRRIDWDQLIEKLVQITHSGAPVVK